MQGAGGGSTNNQKTPTLGELTKTRGGFGTQIGDHQRPARTRMHANASQRGNLEPGKLKMYLFGPKLNQVRFLRCILERKGDQNTKTKNWLVPCCFKAHCALPNAPCGRWRNPPKTPPKNGQGLVLLLVWKSSRRQCVCEAPLEPNGGRRHSLFGPYGHQSGTISLAPGGVLSGFCHSKAMYNNF